MRFHQLEEWFATPLAQKFYGDRLDGAALLRSAQRFYAGDVDLLPVFDLVDFPRLPFNPTAVEFEQIDADGRPHTVITVAEDHPSGTWWAACFQKHPVVSWLPLGGITGQRDALEHPEISINGVVLDILFNDRRPEVLRVAQEAVHAQWHALCRFLEVLNCKNVTTETVLPAAALNRKRLRVGKPPIFEYKVLVLPGRTKAPLASLGGTHASPRVHLRRGHIKRRKTGNFWWEPHVVVGNNPRGVVMKDYDASNINPLMAGEPLRGTGEPGTGGIR